MPMNIVSGDFTGLAGRISLGPMLGQASIEISDGFICHRKILVPEDIASCALILKGQRTSLRHKWLCFLLTLSIVGFPFTIFVKERQKQITAAIALSTYSADHFVILVDGTEWHLLEKCLAKINISDFTNKNVVKSRSVLNS
jgi:hypothetical protein